MHVPTIPLLQISGMIASMAYNVVQLCVSATTTTTTTTDADTLQLELRLHGCHTPVMPIDCINSADEKLWHSEPQEISWLSL
jgi:hypothetical protein